MQMGPPRGLRYGKKTWNVMTAACEFQGTLRAQGHRGLSLTVYGMDGMLYQRFLKLMRARHRIFYDADVGGADFEDPEIEMEKLRDIVVGIRCRAHSLHNSILWGVKLTMPAEISDDVHIMIKSLLNTSSAFHARIDDLARRDDFPSKHILL